MLSLLDPGGAALSAAELYAAAVLHAVAREEHAGRRPKRVLEPDLATWRRFKGRLGPAALLELVVEDAAVTQPEPFAASAVLDSAGNGRPLAGVSDEMVEAWLGRLQSLNLDAPSREYVAAQAEFLSLGQRLAFADLHKVQPHHRVLELPGTGGRIAHYVVTEQAGIFFGDVFTMACGSWQERLLAGIVAVECRTVGPTRIRVDPELELARPEGREKFSHVFGARPEKGGKFARPDLERWFPNADVVLV
jgi:hypothetical protein